MTVEVFKKGSNFKQFIDIIWNVKNIIKNGDSVVLVTDTYPIKTEIFSVVELRVTV